MQIQLTDHAAKRFGERYGMLSSKPIMQHISRVLNNGHWIIRNITKHKGYTEKELLVEYGKDAIVMRERVPDKRTVDNQHNRYYILTVYDKLVDDHTNEKQEEKYDG